MTERQHVADEALRLTPRSIWDWRPVAAALPRARRFILTEDSSSQLGHIIARAEDLILKHHQFALAPYPVTYIEFNVRRMHDSLGRATTGQMPNYIGTEPDEWLGYLITERETWVFARGVEMSSCVTGITYRHTPGHCDLRRSVRRGGESNEEADWTALCLMLGTSVHALPDEETRQALLGNWSLHKNLRLIDYDKFEWRALAGDVRNLLAILLLLNQPEHYTLTSHAPRRRLNRGRPVVYAAHSVVELELGRTRNYRRLFDHLPVDRSGPRRHEVRGHFYHTPASARERCTCPEGHDWPAQPTEFHDDAPTWTCRVCGGRRTWRKHHERGDASRGYVTKEYEVKERSDA